MKQILTIAWREVTRLRKRFGGGASPLAVLLMLAVLGLAGFALRNGATLGNGLYRLGVSGDVPAIRDGRFTVVQVDPARGQVLLEQHAIDVFVSGSQVYSRPDDKSRYALTALKQTLEKLELQRIGSAYSYDLAFPLRVGINYLSATPPPAGAVAPAAASSETIIPSLTPPPAPFTQVIVALLYILPMTFTSIFFTSSFMDEKINRRLVILLSAPVTPFQIILGKMLPYALFSLATTLLIASLTHANVLLALAIYAPTTLFIFAIYLMVPLFYRSFKDTTFIAMLVTTLTTAYLVFPAMFTNISELAYMSPLTLAVKMYRGEPFGWRQYLLPSLPMAAIFGLSMFAGTRMLNEEFLMGYRSLTRKVTDVIYLMLKRARPALAVTMMSLFVIPVVYLAQLVFLAIATNLPVGAMLGTTLVLAALVEEIAKSLSIVVLADHGLVPSTRGLLLLAFLSSFGFLVGEKLLLLLSINSVSQAAISVALFSTGGFLIIPLIAHFIFTSIVLLLRTRAKFSYSLALAIGTILHTLYNWFLTGGLR
jgi:ABC-type Na+ efflux pump permease subunit